MTFSDCLDLIRWARKRQEGQTMAEYAVVLGVITLAVVGVFTALAGGVSGAISTVTGRIQALTLGPREQRGPGVSAVPKELSSRDSHRHPRRPGAGAAERSTARREVTCTCIQSHLRLLPRRDGQVLAEYAVILGAHHPGGRRRVHRPRRWRLGSDEQRRQRLLGRSIGAGGPCIPRSGEGATGRTFDENRMAVATQPVTPLVRPRHVLLVGAFVVGWSVAPQQTRARRRKGAGDRTVRRGSGRAARLDPEPVVAAPTRLHKPARLALAGTLAALVLAGAGLAPDRTTPALPSSTPSSPPGTTPGP